MTEPSETGPEKPEKIVREHVTTLHVIGEQLSQIESWFWQHLADVREAAASAVPAPAADETAPSRRAGLRDEMAAAMREHYLCTNREEADADGNRPCRCGDWREPGTEVDDENDWDSHLAEVALAVLYREWPWLRAEAEDAAVLPADSGRAAVLREEAALIRAHCPDHLDSNSADGSWINCHCDVADDMERRVAAESAPADTGHDGSETGQPFVPPAHYRRDDGVDCCVHAIPVGPDSCPSCRELHDDEQPAAAQQPKEARP